MCKIVIALPFVMQLFSLSKTEVDFSYGDLFELHRPRNELMHIILAMIIAMSGRRRRDIKMGFGTRLNHKNGETCLHCELTFADDNQQDELAEEWSAQLFDLIGNMFKEAIDAIEQCTQLILAGEKQIRFDVGQKSSHKKQSTTIMCSQHAFNFISMLIRRPMRSKLESAIKFTVNDDDYCLPLLFLAYDNHETKTKETFNLEISSVSRHNNEMKIINTQNQDKKKALSATYSDSVTETVFNGCRLARLVKSDCIVTTLSMYGIAKEQFYTILDAQLINHEMDLE